MRRGRATLVIVCVATPLLVGLAYLRHTGLPPRATQVPYIGPFLHNTIGTHTVIRRDGRVLYDFVGRRWYAPPPPPDHAGFWNVLPSPRIVRGESYDTNGVVIASVRGGRGTLAVFNRDGSVRTILKVTEGLPVDETAEEEAQHPPERDK